MKSKLICSLMLISSLVSVHAVPETERGSSLPPVVRSDTDKDAYAWKYAQIPSAIRAFEKMDFDERMKQQEFLRLKFKKTLFIDVVRDKFLHMTDDSKVEVLSMAMEIVNLGHSAETLGSDLTMQKAADACGLKRLSGFISFKKDKKNDNTYFLDGKSPFYKDALMAEMTALDDISRLFDLKEWLTLRQSMLLETWHYEAQHPRSPVVSNRYHEYISQSARTRLLSGQHTEIPEI